MSTKEKNTRFTIYATHERSLTPNFLVTTGQRINVQTATSNILFDWDNLENLQKLILPKTFLLYIAECPFPNGTKTK